VETKTMPRQEPKPEGRFWERLLTAVLIGLTTVFIAGAVFSLALIATGERLTQPGTPEVRKQNR
jgi:hypothetical protein